MGVADATGRIYYDDAYLRSFAARILDQSPDRRRLYLDRTAFYPASGGQPADDGTIGSIPVSDVIDEEDGRIAHVVTEPFSGDAAECALNWPRRFDHMQQHTGQHLLSAVLLQVAGADTVSFHMSADESTIDLAVATLSDAVLAAAEARANEVVCENRPVLVSYSQAGEAHGLRRPSDRQGTLRLVTIEDLDVSACGGTHVRKTGEIGAVLLRGAEKVRGRLRVRFVCGLRAARRAALDYRLLAQTSLVLASSLEAVPSAAAAQRDRWQEAEKARRKLELERVDERGRMLYASASAAANGRRIQIMRLQSGGIDEEVRRLAEAFTSQPGALFAAAAEEDGSLLIVISEGAGVDAGALLRTVIAQHGGKGGGSARAAQGKMAGPAAVVDAVDYIARRWLE